MRAQVGERSPAAKGWYSTGKGKGKGSKGKGGKGKGGKNKNKKVRNEVKKEVAPEDDVNLTPYKGKPSNFFVMD